MVDFFHQCSERNKKAIYGTPSWWTAVRPAACHGKILSPQNAINGTPRHHPYIHPLSSVYYKTDKDARPKTEHMWNLGEDKEGKTPKLGQVQQCSADDHFLSLAMVVFTLQ